VESTRQNVPVFREWVAQIAGVEDIEIRARVSGWLQGLHFAEGTQIRQGALLYTIDQSELLEAVAGARAKLAQAKTLLARAKSDVERYRPLAAAGAVSQRDLEQAEAEYGARLSEVDAAQASLNVAQINLGYASIRAPITGLIGISAARVGDYVGRPPNPVILNTISRIDTVRVRFSLTEQEYLDVARRFAAAGRKQGVDPVPFQLILADGSLYPQTGRVKSTQRNIDPATGTLQLEALFKNSDHLLRPGQFGRVRAAFEERKDAVVVPAIALMEIQGQSVLYTVGADGKAQFRRIVVGPKAGALQVVEKGLEAGEKVIVEGLQRIRPEMTVAPRLVPLDSVITPSTGGGR
jgi:membrane fusion protein (multidrug efflux system)